MQTGPDKTDVRQNDEDLSPLVQLANLAKKLSEEKAEDSTPSDKMILSMFEMRIKRIINNPRNTQSDLLTQEVSVLENQTNNYHNTGRSSDKMMAEIKETLNRCKSK